MISSSHFFQTSSSNKPGAFRDCVLLWPNTTVREFAKILHPEIDKYYLYAESAGGTRVSYLQYVMEAIIHMLIAIVNCCSWRRMLSSPARTISFRSRLRRPLVTRAHPMIILVIPMRKSQARNKS